MKNLMLFNFVLNWVNSSGVGSTSTLDKSLGDLLDFNLVKQKQMSLPMYQSWCE